MLYPERVPRPQEPVSAPARGRVRHLPVLAPLLGPARRLSRRGGVVYRWARRQWRRLRPAQGAADAPRLKSRLFLLALMLTGAYHGTLVMTRAYARADGTGSLLFQASAYARNLFDPWDDRWYGGVPLTGQPPLVPQLIALLTAPLGVEGAFGAAQFLSVALLVWAVYRVTLTGVSLPSGAALGGSAARDWVQGAAAQGTARRVAGVAALLGTLSSALTLQLNVFGHHGSVLGVALALHAAPSLWAWLRAPAGQRGWASRRAFAWRAALPLLAAGTADPASALLIGLGALLAGLPLGALRPPQTGGPPAARQRGAGRAVMAAGLLLLQYLLSGWAGWFWSPGASAPDSAPLAQGRSAWLCLGLPLWSVLWTLPTLPGVFRSGPRRWGPAARLALLAAPLLTLCALGLLGFSPLRVPPETLAFLAALLLLPLSAQVVLRAWDAARQVGAQLPLMLAAALTLLVTVGLNALPRTRVLEGPAINLQPLLNFIEKDEHWRYRYLTVGFGRQLGLLSAQTRAATTAGLWHLPPDLPQLNPAPTAYAALPERAVLPGFGSFAEQLTHPERAYLKFVYARGSVMDPLLYLHGWHNIGTLENGVNVWEREDVPPIPARLPRSALPVPVSAVWGVGPLLTLTLALLGVLVAGQTERRPAPAPLPAGSLTGSPLMGSPRGSLHPPAWVGDLPPLPVTPASAAQARPLRRAATLPVRVVALTVLATLLVAGGLRFVPGWVTAREWAARVAHPPTGGGLRGEYARLDGFQVRLTRSSGQAGLTARVTARWWTPLGTRTTYPSAHLTLGRGGWTLAPDLPGAARLLPGVPSPQPDVAYYRAPRRITTNATAPADVLDRPVVQVLSARTVLNGARVTAVGELLNADARPADLTLGAALRGPDGQVLAQENLGLLGVHKLRPGERTPWQVTLPPLPPGTDPAGVTLEIAARAVVTGRNLERSLAARSRVTAGAGGRVSVQARNVSTRTIATPQALLTLYDARGVAWVYSALGPELRPGQSWRFSLPATLPAGARLLRVEPPPRPYDGTTVTPALTAPGSFPLPGGGSYSLAFQTLPASEAP
ncbi:hypothetical protein GCM10008961_36950 [Deinococcus knuensis]|uniref:YfhO family protein n=1 Tax=Deinococcus knuensis TaxID=1837380 RepID=A0ABQ2SWW7_9DEIO|nr:hypothetical protein GCM10008961_36950 [Deinococcus knuensis]